MSGHKVQAVDQLSCVRPCLQVCSLASFYLNDALKSKWGVELVEAADTAGLVDKLVAGDCIAGAHMHDVHACIYACGGGAHEGAAASRRFGHAGGCALSAIGCYNWLSDSLHPRACRLPFFASRSRVG